MGYTRDPQNPGSWLYDGLRIQAEFASHRFVVSYARAHLPQRGRVLDLAAGEGALSKQLVDAGFQVAATSWNERCRVPDIVSYRLNLDLPFHVADVGGEPFPLLCAIEIIEHVENPASFLRHCRELLAPDGKLILSTPNVESAPARLQWLVRGSPLMFDAPEVRHNRHISMMWRHGLEHLIGLAGLRILERHFLSDPPPPGRGVRGAAKQLVYAVMQRTLPGDLQGSTRLYVLSQSDATPRSAGPSQVY